MIGKDPTGAGGKPRHPEPIGHEPLNRAEAWHADADTRFPVEPGSSRMLPGRRISFTAWAIAGVVGVVLWMIVIQLA